MRRLRTHPRLREMVRETRLSPSDFILPLFIRHGENQRLPISSMPGHSQLTVDLLAEEVKEIASLGIPAVILFGIPAEKDAVGSDACDDQGIVAEAVRAIKASGTDLLVVHGDGTITLSDSQLLDGGTKSIKQIEKASVTTGLPYRCLLGIITPARSSMTAR